MSCTCSLVALLNISYSGIFSASLNGSTTIEVAEDGLLLLGSRTNSLNIGAYAYRPGQDRYLGASCPFSASANIPWVTKEDCATGRVYYIPKLGAKATLVNRSGSGVSSSIISMECSPDIVDTAFDANASSGPATPFVFSNREDGFNLVYNGNPIPVQTGRPIGYTINLGFVGSITAFLQSFSLNVNPPDVAKVQYSFVFSDPVT